MDRKEASHNLKLALKLHCMYDILIFNDMKQFSFLLSAGKSVLKFILTVKQPKSKMLRNIPFFSFFLGTLKKRTNIRV
jgi:hypothetical protein